MNQPGDDALERRLRAANPVPPGRTLPPSGRTLAELLEATMSTDLTEPAQRMTTRSWRLAAAAAAAVGALAAGGTYLAVHDNSPGTRAAAGPHKTVLTLHLPHATGPSLGSCIQFSADTLRPMQVAFSGTVTSTAAQSVTLTVDHWYRGGTADEVRLTTPDPSVPTTAEGSVDLIDGHRYLVTANDGTVTTCGFTTEWTPELAAVFKQAFES